MNSKQRRKQKRKFKYQVSVEIADLVGSNMIHRLNSMLVWCHRNYGENGYLYQWPNKISFCFPTEQRAVEFKLRWSDG